MIPAVVAAVLVAGLVLVCAWLLSLRDRAEERACEAERARDALRRELAERRSERASLGHGLPERWHCSACLGRLPMHEDWCGRRNGDG